MPGPGSRIHWVGARKARSRLGFFCFFWKVLKGGMRCSFGGGEEERYRSCWECLMGQHPELAALNHGGGKVHHKRVCLQMQVTKHFVGAPASDKFYDVGVYLAAKKCHGAASTKGAGGDI